MSDDAKTFEDEIGFDEAKTSTFPKYQGTKDVTDRIAILSPNVVRHFVHYHDKKSIRCLSTPDKEGICCKTLSKPPEQKFGVPIFKYSTDHEGDLANDQKCQGRVMLWIFSDAKMDLLKPLARLNPIVNKGAEEEQVDLLVSCSDTDWQRLAINVVPGTAHFKSKKEWAEKLEQEAPRAVERIKRKLGGTPTEVQVREALGLVSGPAPGQASEAEVDLGDILED